MDLIIKQDDPRYKDLNKLFSLRWDDLVYREETSVYYFIPPELVLKDEDFSRGFSIKSLREDFKDDWTNWFSSKSAGTRLENNCNLSKQDYFDLCILHINDRSLRPTCDQCGKPLTFSNRIYYGYNKTYCWNEGRHNFCSNECSAKYQNNHDEEFPENLSRKKSFVDARYRPEVKVYTDYRSFCSRGPLSDNCYLYIAKEGEWYKIGVTNDLTHRARYFDQSYDTIHKLREGSREDVAKLEAIIKLHNEGIEYFSEDHLGDLFQILRTTLGIRPIPNPFE